MLNEINIKNFTLIDALTVYFKNGMVVLTGETGAGKSILIDAIELALGKRITHNVIRPGENKADICLSFDISQIPDAKDFLESHELLNENECFIRRTIQQDGKSKSYINGIPATQQTLKKLSELLINIHGQHEFQTLLQPEKQLILLDNFAGHAALLKEIKMLYRDWETTKITLENLTQMNQEATARVEFLKYQITEIENLNLQDQEVEKMHQEHKQLANAETLLSNCHAAVAAIDEADTSATQLLNHALQALEKIININDKLSNAYEALNNAMIEASEASNDVRDFLSQIDLNPEKLQWLEARMQSIHDIARKHRIEPENLLSHYQQMQMELRTLETRDESLQTLETKITELTARYTTFTKQLTQSRLKAAKKLSQLITKNIQQLGMPGGKFDITFETRETMHEKGAEKIRFMVSANPGHPLQPLNQVASGGELSRISLAIQVITNQQSETPILVFDEVDIGIGGATAEIVGKLLHQLSQTTQILCITHLAQVAANGHQHLRIQKHQEKNNTKITITDLTQSERIDEIARMTGGVKITEQTRAHAKEMLSGMLSEIVSKL